MEWNIGIVLPAHREQMSLGRCHPVGEQIWKSLIEALVLNGRSDSRCRSKPRIEDTAAEEVPTPTLPDAFAMSAVPKVALTSPMSAPYACNERKQADFILVCMRAFCYSTAYARFHTG